MNFKTKIYGKTQKLRRIQQELEDEVAEFDDYNPEVGADVRWAIISLGRAILGLKK